MKLAIQRFFKQPSFKFLLMVGAILGFQSVQANEQAALDSNFGCSQAGEVAEGSRLLGQGSWQEYLIDSQVLPFLEAHGVVGKDTSRVGVDTSGGDF